MAPTYGMLRDITLRTFSDVAGPVLASVNKSDMIARMAWGTEILLRSADNPDRLRGINAAWGWLDEAALCPEGTWEILIARLRQFGQAGPAWLTTTPKGRNWVYRLMTAMRMLKARTADNPYLDKLFVKTLENAYTGDFARQELEAEFVTFQGLVYEEFDRTRHVWQGALPDFKQIVAGVDEGYTNPNVALILGLDADDRAYVIDEFHRARVMQEDFVAECVALQRKHNVARWRVDPSAAGLIAALRKAGLRVGPANNDVKQGIQHLKARLVPAGDGKPRLYFTPGIVWTMTEMEQYVWKDGAAGGREDVDKQNDHGPDALRYALMPIGRAGRLVLWGDDGE